MEKSLSGNITFLESYQGTPLQVALKEYEQASEKDKEAKKENLYKVYKEEMFCLAPPSQVGLKKFYEQQSERMSNKCTLEEYMRLSEILDKWFISKEQMEAELVQSKEIDIPEEIPEGYVRKAKTITFLEKDEGTPLQEALKEFEQANDNNKKEKRDKLNEIFKELTYFSHEGLSADEYLEKKHLMLALTVPVNSCPESLKS